MVEIRLYNTKTRKKERFVPLDPGNVRMYVCGPTVYDRAHMGNARPVVVFDVLFRLLRQVYGSDHVTYVRNFTDVDDKINARAAEMAAKGDARPLETIIRELTDTTIGWYHEDMDALGALRPTQEPRATEWIGAMIAMIEGLIETGHAYAADGHVLFDVRSYAGYGALSGRSVDDMIAGARVEVAPYKRDPMDFVLWKPSSDDLPGWDSPWGRGRPGWHIECSAMSHELLGARFDIHGGGIDLQFPHHENEVAQSCCAHPAPAGEDCFAQVWMHNEMLQVEGRKMSKSLGNFFTVHDLLEQGIPGEVIRLVYLGTHYSKPMDWTARKADDARRALMRWRKLFEGVPPTKPATEVETALGDDLNTAAAVNFLAHMGQALRQLANEILEAGGNPRETERFTRQAGEFVASARLLGLLEEGMGDWALAPRVDLGAFASRLSEARQAAIETKDFTEVDRLKAALLAAGVQVMMRKDGVDLEAGPDFDAEKLEALK